jgi:hypothetical protein
MKLVSWLGNRVLTKQVVAVQIKVVFHLFDPIRSFVINYIQPTISPFVRELVRLLA